MASLKLWLAISCRRNGFLLSSACGRVAAGLSPTDKVEGQRRCQSARFGLSQWRELQACDESLPRDNSIASGII